MALSDVGSRDHPEYRAEQSFWRVLRQPGVGLDHPTRAFLAVTVALRYDAEPETGYLAPALALLDPEEIARAVTLGSALRLAFFLSAGTPEMLAEVAIRREAGRVVLTSQGAGVAAGEGVARRLDRLAASLAMVPAIE